MKLSTKKIVLILCGAFLTILISVLIFKNTGQKTSAGQNSSQDLKPFTAQELSQYNGDDPNRPIYLVLNGLVYNITPGKKFYAKGGGYHYLAGRDSSAELNFIGGGIIKRKYQVIGRLIK